MNILIDEDLPKALTQLLASYGHNVDHVCDIGLGGSSDRVVFEAAQQREAILISADVEFGNPHIYSNHCGIIILRFPDNFRRDDIVALVNSFLGEADISSLRGVLVIVSPGGFRTRRLRSKD